MIIRHLKIENFRGIRSLDWHLLGRVLCLVGPNDSTKTSILDAIELVLLPRMNPQISDADFHNLNIEEPISIEATIGELPQELLDDEKFGLYLRGYELSKAIKDDPNDNCEPVITVRFSMNGDLEPEWAVVKTGQEEPRTIGWRDRGRLGLARLGADVDKHLTWARGSALSKLTEDDNSIGQAFLEATRKAREIVAGAELDSLSGVASKACESAKTMGAEFKELRHGLDASALSLGSSVLGLHEANIPVRQWGLGTRRLAALAIQQSGIGQKSILLIDEIEHGLEPHRQRHLLKRLCSDETGIADRECGQVIFSTHSPTSIIALPVQNLRFVRSVNGLTAITEVKPEFIKSLQGIARSHSPAFLGRKLLICEGATEVGLCRGLEDHWSKEKDGRHPTHIGFVPVDSGGRTKASNVAIELKRIGYDVAILADSDKPLEPGVDELGRHNIPFFLWEGNMCTEQRLATDLPVAAIQILLDGVFQELDSQSVLDQIGSCCGINNLTTRGKSLSDWLDTDLPIEKAREALGKAANKNSWFKNVTLGIRLGEIVAENLPKMSTTSTATTLAALLKWIYG